MELAIAGGLVLIFGIVAIVYFIGFYGERSDHWDTKTALEACRDSLRRAQGKVDDLQCEVSGHTAELARAKREGRQELAEEIQDAEVKAAEAAIETLNGRLAALEELHEADAIADEAFRARSEELSAEIGRQEDRISAARREARSRTGVPSLFYSPGACWP